MEANAEVRKAVAGCIAMATSAGVPDPWAYVFHPAIGKWAVSQDGREWKARYNDDEDPADWQENERMVLATVRYLWSRQDNGPMVAAAVRRLGLKVVG